MKTLTQILTLTAVTPFAVIALVLHAAICGRASARKIIADAVATYSASRLAKPKASR